MTTAVEDDWLTALRQTLPVGDVLIFEPLEDGDRGTRVKRSGPYFVDVREMAFNWRITLTPVDAPYVYDKYWCYAGKSPAVFTRAVMAAALMDVEGDPLGWNKNGQTQEWRAP